ncbi:transmembrane protein 272-like [Triplophysa dalaica]|uniref:transmembrane protein 272-like n=1 Tax=Triplophysa dalaica TaxID=1582913 RepID=UPI0024DF451A|nr:transmembrane protein 272-like [Triplophysa dalaica]
MTCFQKYFYAVSSFRHHGSKTNVACLVITKLLCMAFPIAQIAIGAVYLQDCPRQHYIPIYLLVSGVFGVFLGLLTCLPCAKETEEEGPNKLRNICGLWNSLVSAFIFCWVICGSVWIYSIYPPNYNQTLAGDLYCNKTLYLFAFWTTTLGYILLALVLLISCCCCVCSCIFGTIMSK